MSAMLKPNPKRHSHQCGRVKDGWLEGYGCGALWFHQRDTSLSIVDDHKCPVCRAGPWYYELSQEEVESAGIHPQPSRKWENLPTLD
jgi:hypothetical protein